MAIVRSLVNELAMGGGGAQYTIETDPDLRITFWVESSDQKLYAHRTEGDEVIIVTISGIWE